MSITRGTALRSRRGRGANVSEVALSDEITVGVRYRNLASLIMLGELPNPLRALVADLDRRGQGALDDEDGARLQQYFQLVDKLGTAMIVEPGWCSVEELAGRDAPEDERLCLYDLGTEEMNALVTIAFKGLDAFESFRDQRAGAPARLAERAAAPAADADRAPQAAAARGGVSRSGRPAALGAVEPSTERAAHRAVDTYDATWERAAVARA